MSEQMQLKQLKEQMSKLAEQIAQQEFDIRLDYSPESIKEVEYILGEIHRKYKRTNSEEGLQGIAFEFAAYIVKVIEENFGTAEWTPNHHSMGENSFPLLWRNSTLFPFSWCLKRIYDGEVENVWIKFKTFVIDKTQQMT